MNQYTYFVCFLYFLEFFPRVFIRVRIRMKFSSQLSSVSDASERDKLSNCVAKRTEKYIFFTSAAVASFLTPST
jgi:hypothetical protein